MNSWDSEQAVIDPAESVLAPRRLASDLLSRFVRIETAGSVVLLSAAVLALLWVNSPWGAGYTKLWQAPLSFSVADWSIAGDLRHWVNEGLMTIFFFVVGLEIKIECVHGHLRDRRAALTPVLAAAGGMLVPAFLYLLVARGASTPGWGIPMATDIAFAVGVLGLLGRRVPPAARIFLLTLAIADDVGAIVVIAVFYAATISWDWLGLVLVLLGIVVAIDKLRVRSISAYLVLGVATWFAMYQSGVHATIAGVALGLLTPALPLLRQREARMSATRVLTRGDVTTTELVRLRFLIYESLPVATRLQARLEPVSSFVVLPIFALANAGVAVDPASLERALDSQVTLGVILGLVVGKVVGITATTWAAARTGIGRLPAGTSWPLMAGVGLIAGVGFTVALLVAELSFPGQATLLEDAKIGILLASISSAIAGLLLVRLVSSPAPAEQCVGADSTDSRT